MLTLIDQDIAHIKRVMKPSLCGDFGGPILPPCAVTVLTGGLPQARVTDMLTCVGPPDTIVLGSFTVLVSGMPAARMLDMTAHGGLIILGEPTVLIGG